MNLLKIFLHQIKMGNLSHAYLVFEDFSVEKISSLLKISVADLLILEEPIKINHIRELIHWLSLKPHSSLKRLVIISGAENLNLESANALLKILEEPPASSIIILKARRKEKILPTILSRCQIIKPKNSNAPEIIDNYLSPKDLGQKSVLDRFKYFKEIFESGGLPLVLNLWEKDFQERLKNGENVLMTLKQISRIRSLLSSNVSLKLLLENLLLKM